MPLDLPKLKKRALELEAKNDLDGAIAAYRQIVEAFDAGEAEPIDIPLYNRLGDLLIKDGRSTDAIQLWERAVDLYMDGGFLNPAIALCNKILRASPGRTVAYYKLGRCLAEKGFRAEARQNFLEYATRMERAGNAEESFRALTELADLVPGQDDVRVMLAEQLVRADRIPAAIEQLQIAHGRLVAAGKLEEAEAVATKVRELDPSAELEGAARLSRGTQRGLVFLDLDGQPAAPAAPPGPSFVQPGLEIESTSYTVPEEPAATVGGLIGFETTSLVEEVTAPVIEPPSAGAGGLDLIDLGDVSDGLSTDLSGALLDASPPTAGPVGDLEIDLIDIPGDEPPAPAAEPGLLDLPFISDEPAPTPPSEFGFLTLDAVPRHRPTSTVLQRPIDMLRAQLGEAPNDWGLHRAYGESLLDEGQREEGIAELETALAGFEAAGDLDAARQIADDLVRLQPGQVRYHQKRVEFTFATGTAQARLTSALALGDLLQTEGQLEQARAVYERVLALDPDDLRAQAALDAIAPPPAPAAPATTAPARPSGLAPGLGAIPQFEDLGAWLRDEEAPLPTRPAPRSTRMVAEAPRVENGSADFSDVLEKFKAGVAESVDAEDYASHYDLGVAYKEMGLLDEAIAQFQKAVRAPVGRVRALEALGACFVERGQLAVAATILQRAFDEPDGTDESLIAVLDLLGEIATRQGDLEAAIGYLSRVVAVDILFRDANARLEALLAGSGDDEPVVAEAPSIAEPAPRAPKRSATKSAKTSAKPSAKPTAKPSAKPTAKPSAKPTAKPSVKPATKSSAPVAAKPVAKKKGATAKTAAPKRGK